MVKQGQTRKTKTVDGPAARRRKASVAPTSNPEGATSASRVSHEEIAARAHELFLARGGRHGDDLADWFHAEAELVRTRDDGGTPSMT